MVHSGGDTQPDELGIGKPVNRQLDGKLVVMLGGSGFFGRHVAQELLARGARLRIASRHPERAYALKPLAALGQVQFLRCDVTNAASLAGAPITSDQWALLKAGNFASGTLPGIDALGIVPRPLGLFLDRWMVRYRAHGRFGTAPSKD